MNAGTGFGAAKMLEDDLGASYRDAHPVVRLDQGPD
jgi:hypothetical protein